MSAAINGMEDLVREFLAESAEGLDLIEHDLVELEHDPASLERLSEILRALHTLKGNSSMLGYPKLEAIAHAGEGLLDGLRDGKLALNPELTNALLAMVDALRDLLRTIERSGSEGDDDYSGFLRRLRRPPEGAAPVATVSISPIAGMESLSDSHSANRKVRVSIDLLDRLMDLVGELVPARDQVLRCTSFQTDSAVLQASLRLKRITTEIQQSVMMARLQPIGSVWSRFPRLARDVASSCGKQVVVEMKGSEIEVDRGMIEAIKAPLTHILRNAIDHGIETPEQRLRAGKTAAGHLRFRAFHQEGWVQLEISDDGSGIDVKRVLRRALELGLVTPQQAGEMDARQAAWLVFAPGFSTASAVTSLSGRGVGLDVVRTNIQKMGGEIEIQSMAGQGTTLRIKVPLTLAVVPVLVVSVSGERFAIPQASLLEVVRLPASRSAAAIEQVCGAPVYRLRDQLLPLCFLDRELHLEPRATDTRYIAVLDAGSGRFGLVVDAVNDTEEIVVKPLGRQLRTIAFYAGAAILGDGRVALVLDVAGLAGKAGIAADCHGDSQDRPATAGEQQPGARPSWLIVRGAEGSRFALPRSAVLRLETIPANCIERSAEGEVVQYRGQVLRLLHISRLFHQPERDPEWLHVVIVEEYGVTAGLVVGGFEDIVSQALEVRGESHTDLLEGSAVVGERSADVLNLKRILGLLKDAAPSCAGDGKHEA